MRIRRVPGLVSATALSAVTLGIFGTLQNYGPESAVRRFHHAALMGSDQRARHDEELRQVVVGAWDSRTVVDLERFVQAFGRDGYRIQTSERSATQVEILATYQGRALAVWVVVRARDRWRIDPYLTYQGLKRLGYRIQP